MEAGVAVESADRQYIVMAYMIMALYSYGPT